MTPELIAHLETVDEPLFVPRARALRWTDEQAHTSAFASNPEAYALIGIAPGVKAWQRTRVLLQILGSSWAGLDTECRDIMSRVSRVLVLGLPATHVVTVLLALRHRRANHKHVTRATVRLLVDHPQIDQLMGTHRRVLVACFEHALGKTTARGCARALMKGGGGDADLHRQLYRFATDHGRAAARVRSLYSPGFTAVDYVAMPAVDLDQDSERPDTVTATNRGDVAATLVHIYRGGAAPDLQVALSRYVAAAAGRVPRYPGTLAMVVDQSASMRGYGDREWALLSQAVALRMVLERTCARLVTIPVGGSDDRAEGSTDLATAVLDAVQHRPDLVAVVSDGYENVYPGDLARVVATLPHMGVTTPVVFCHTTFGHSDDLTLRRPAPALPQRAFWHESDFGPLLLWLLAHTRTAEAELALRDGLLRRLAAAEARLAEHTGVMILEGSTR